ncbi:MAG: glycosyltransferase [Candidatus Rokubacteria bacterium]|nr:glycosyltransferase [Candidatus Rokubacteria bacterium]
MSATVSVHLNGHARTARISGHRGLRVLFLSQRFLYPLDSGGRIRTAKILEGLKKMFHVTLVSQVDPGKDAPYLGEVDRVATEFHGVIWRERPKYTARFYLRVLARALSPYPVTVANDYSPALAATLERLAAERRHDLLVCDFLQPSLNVRGIDALPTLLFQHNVESMIPRRHFEAAAHPLLKAFWWSQWRKMRRFERAQCQRFTSVAAVSDVDKDTLEREFGARRVFLVPTGVDTHFFRPAESAPDPSALVFTGAMDWLPNEDAMLFFGEAILPRIRERRPDVTLTIVGRNPSPRLSARLAAHPGITITGRVDDIRPFLAQAAVYVIPLRIGGGTRIKAFEAMAMGKPVVSTPIGVEGLRVDDGLHLVLAREPEAFADAVLGLLESPERRQRVGSAARALVEREFSWDRAASAFADACLATAAR